MIGICHNFTQRLVVRTGEEKGSRIILLLLFRKLAYTCMVPIELYRNDYIFCSAFLRFFFLFMNVSNFALQAKVDLGSKENVFHKSFSIIQLLVTDQFTFN